MATNFSKELGWDDEVSQESTFTLLEEGDYRFRFVSMERGRHNGSTKLPACNKAICKLAILNEQGQTLTELTHNLFLHSSVEGLLSAFFLALGVKKHGEPLNISQGFRAGVGQTGYCHIYVDKWTGDDGKERESNKIKYFIDPEKAPADQAASAKAAPAAPTGGFTWGK